LRNRELEAQKYSRPRTWRIKQTADKGKPSADINLLFTLPAESNTPLKHEHGKHKCPHSEIVKEDATKDGDGRQQPIQVVGSKDIS
jgi:hypothetical protein